MDYTNSPLADRLLKRLETVGTEEVRQATAVALGRFHAYPSKCHENVDRWCQQYPCDKPVRGWLVDECPYAYTFTKHSIVDLGGQHNLLDITLQNGGTSNFLIHIGAEEEFLLNLDSHVTAFIAGAFRIANGQHF